MDSLNLIALTGYLERSPVMRWNDNNQAFVTATLRLEESGAGGTVYRTYIPCEGYSKVAEQLGTVTAGDVVSIEGKLMWRSTTAAAGTKKGSLSVLVRSVHVLIPAGEGVAHAQAP